MIYKGRVLGAALFHTKENTTLVSNSEWRKRSICLGSRLEAPTLMSMAHSGSCSSHLKVRIPRSTQAQGERLLQPGSASGFDLVIPDIEAARGQLIG